MILHPVAQMMTDNPRTDLMYFLTGVMFALLPTTVFGLIGFFVIRDWFRHHRHKAAPSGPGASGQGR